MTLLTTHVYIDFDQDGDFDDAIEDVTPYLMEADWGIGFRNPFQVTSDEARCTLRLTNLDKRFSPEYSASPYYPNLKPHRGIKITNTHNGAETTMWRGWIETIEVAPGTKGDRSIVIVGVGAKSFLQAAEVSLPLLENVKADTVIAELFKAAAFPPATFSGWLAGVVGSSEAGVTTVAVDAAQAYDLDEGINTWSYVGDNWDTFANAYVGIESAAEADLGRFYFDRDGKGRFINRHTLARIETIALTISDRAQGFTYLYGDVIRNDVRVNIYPRSLSANNNEVLWQLDKPMQFRIGDEKTVRARFTGDAGETIAGRDVQTPTGGDFVFTGALSITSFVADAQTATIIIRCNGVEPSSGEAELTTLVVRGQMVTSYAVQTVQEVNTESIYQYGRRVYQVDNKLIDDDVYAQNVALYHLSIHQDPRGLMAGVMVMVDDDWSAGAIVDQTLFDRITVAETHTAHSADYLIIGEQHRWEMAGKRYTCDWTLEPASVYFAWLAGVPGRSEAGVTTYAGL
jgi:hypothetical protein